MTDDKDDAAPDTATLRELLAAGTPGKWWIATMKPAVISAGARDVARCYKSADTRGTEPSANAALIVAAVNALPGLMAERDRMREALGWFLADERFRVAVGGNPDAVERMLADARAALLNAGEGE